MVLVSLSLATLSAWVLRVALLEPLDDSRRQRQLVFLDRALVAGAAERSQQLFPEGFAFQHALTGLAHAAAAAPGDEAALRAARAALQALGTPAGAAQFQVSSPPKGAFHAGWSLLLAVEVSRLSRDPADLRAVQERARPAQAAVAARLDAGASPFLDSYPGQSWPVDTVVLVAALARADAQVPAVGAAALIDRWRRAAERRSDGATGLLPHRTRADGTAVQGARGSSQSLIQSFWPDIDPAGAPESYRRFVRHFVDRCAGLVGVREYPRGRDGRGDVDSGPLIDGCSASATAVTLAAALRNGDLPLARTLDREAELAWTPRPGGRRYAAGLVPVADAFLAWARAQPVGTGAASGAPQVAWAWWVGIPALGSLLCALVAARSVRRLRSGRPAG